MKKRNSHLIETLAEVIERDAQDFANLTRQELTPTEVASILNPIKCFPKEKQVLALHWHPEQVPLPLIRKRIETMFPAEEEHLIIPTQHNQLVAYDEFVGVEVDCYSPEFNQKVQLLLHFHQDQLKDAQVLESMLEHTFKYRSSQLFQFLDCLTGQWGEFILNQAAAQTGANEAVVDFAAKMASKLTILIDQNVATLHPEAVKNKLIRYFIDLQRPYYGHEWIDRVQVFVNQVKTLIKRDFDLSYFYQAQAFIEETRALGGSIVIPHPEQFWPILLADYDVDGIEAWNPQSFRYTDFLINVIEKKNRTRPDRERPILILFGDDCHLGEKLKEKTAQNAEKASREIGFQPPWEDLHIQKLLITAGSSKARVIAEYKNRLLS